MSNYGTVGADAHPHDPALPADDETGVLLAKHDHGDGDAMNAHGGPPPKPPKNCVDRALEWVLPPGSIAASAFNLCAATLGAGTLGLPYAMAHTGSVIGTTMLVLCGLATVFTVGLLIETLESTGHATYEALSKHLFGARFEKVVAFLIVMFCWGCACVYVVVIGSIIKPMQAVKSLPQGAWGVRLMTCIFWVLFMFPLSLLRDINSLRYASLVGFLSTVYLVIAIVAFAALRDVSEKGNVIAFHPPTFNFWSSMTVFSFSYCCQTNAFEIYHELSAATPGRMKRAAGVSMTFCTALYIVSGIAGIAAFGEGVQSNILNNFSNPQNVAYLLLAFLAITFTVTMAFPVAIFPTRDAVLQMMGYKNAYDTPTTTRIVVCTLLATSALILGLFVPNIQVLFSVLGGVCGSSLGYCLPVLFAWKAGVLRWEHGRVRFVAAWVIFVLGAVFGTVGTITTIVSQIQGSDPAPAAVGNMTSTTTTTTIARTTATAAVQMLFTAMP